MILYLLGISGGNLIALLIEESPTAAEQMSARLRGDIVIMIGVRIEKIIAKKSALGVIVTPIVAILGPKETVKIACTATVTAAALSRPDAVKGTRRETKEKNKSRSWSPPSTS